MSAAPCVLVVEDHPLNLKLVRDVLGFAGYDVAEARTGEAAVRVARECHPDLVLMDLQLPGIDGTETMQRLRADVLDVTVPVVALTALAMAEDRAKVAEAGFDGYLEKPIQVREFAAQVASYLRKGRQP